MKHLIVVTFVIAAAVLTFGGAVAKETQSTATTKHQDPAQVEDLMESSEIVKLNLSSQDDSHDKSIHTYISVDKDGTEIILEDSSRWLVHPEDLSKFHNWHVGDPISITQSSAWFSTWIGYWFDLYNERTKDFINIQPTELYPKDIAMGHYEIKDFNFSLFSAMYIVLDDNSKWYVDPKGGGFWSVGDRIIIGKNSSKLKSWTFPYILINIDEAFWLIGAQPEK